MIDLQSLPTSPGCYLFKDLEGNTIYVGKAKDLKHRVSSYFSKKHEDEKTKILVSKIDSIDFFATDTEVEALVLENNLIKKHRPKYNIDLKDSKGYAYIQVTNEEVPRLLVARVKSGDGEFFGPFTSAESRDYVLEALRRIFKIRTCKKLPKKECIRYAIGLCSAPCTKKISLQEYLEDINSAKMVLKGSIKNLVKKLENNMKEASLRLDYERALSYRNQIKAVKTLAERQNVERNKTYDEDIINWVVHEKRVHLLVFNARKGILENKVEFEFENRENFIEEFLVQYYSQTEIPKEIILPIEVDSSIQEYLTNLKRKNLASSDNKDKNNEDAKFFTEKVIITKPELGSKKELLDLVKKNIELSLFGDKEKIEDLQKKLGLNDYPAVIEAFDISHLSGTLTTASMVQFRNAKPDKSNYRRFKIVTVDKIDDFASMKEVIRRRYYKIKIENLTPPNLILIDGGKGQLSAALEELDKLNLKIPIIALAKQNEEIYMPGESEPIVLPKNSKALKLLQQIRDEAHRFAVKYNSLLRIKKVREK